MKFFVDTNVWLDYYIDRSVQHQAAGQFIVSATAAECDLFTSIGTVKDCYFLLGRELKRMASRDGFASASDAQAADEVAWACVANMRRLSTVVYSDEGDLLEAMTMRREHPDLEDNLVAAAAKRVGADYLVTQDKKLLAHAPIPCLDIPGALEALEFNRPS